MASEFNTSYQELTISVTNFSVNFIKNVSSEIEGNFVLSAFSTFMVLSMATFGAKGTTEQQMRQILYLPENYLEAYQGFENLNEYSNNIKNVIFSTAQRIYVSKNFPIKDTFKNITRKYFNSETTELNFTQYEESATIINQWCFNKTNGKISKIVTNDDIKQYEMLLLNAIYFKGDWLIKFKKQYTRLLPFHINSSTTITVPTMFMEQDFYYREFENLDAKCVGIPYQNRNIIMMIIIPNEIDNIKDVEKNLDKFMLTRQDLKRRVRLLLPKFKIQTSIELEKTLKQMGMSQVFSNEANFKGISDMELKIDKVFQKAFIEVDENGSEATAATLSGLTLLSLPDPRAKFIIDRPFLFQILDIERKLILFSGRVKNPKYDE